MTYTSQSDPFIERLDALAEATPFPKMAREGVNQHPRPQRFLPALFIAVSIAALVMSIGGSKFAFALIMFTFTATILLEKFGPMRGESWLAPHDERETAIYTRARLIGVSCAALFAILGCMWLSMSMFWPMIWHPTMPQQWQVLAIFMINIAINATMLALSWTMPDPVDDEG